MAYPLLRFLDYARYSIMAFEAGVPLTRIPALRRAANLIAALGRMDRHGALRIVDVGAHRGEWGLACARALPRSQILSFEPVAEYYQDAVRQSAKCGNWKVQQLGLGQERGVHPIAVQGQRSSFKRLVGSKFPEWARGNIPTERVEAVDVDTLDAVLRREEFLPVDLLKIDAEGYEREILRGAEKTLRDTKQVLIEVRFEELFAGAPLFAEVDEILKRHGFSLMHLKPCDGQCLWADATYAKAG